MGRILNTSLQIDDNPKSESPPPGLDWPGPWYEVKIPLLDAETQRIQPGGPEYGLGFTRIRFIATRSLTLVGAYTPTIVYADDENIELKSRGILQGPVVLIQTCVRTVTHPATRGPTKDGPLKEVLFFMTPRE